jgi:hypothetical protein
LVVVAAYTFQHQIMAAQAVVDKSPGVALERQGKGIMAVLEAALDPISVLAAAVVLGALVQMEPQQLAGMVEPEQLIHLELA